MHQVWYGGDNGFLAFSAALILIIVGHAWHVALLPRVDIRDEAGGSYLGHWIDALSVTIVARVVSEIFS